MAGIGDLIMNIVAEMKGFQTSIIKEGEQAGTKAAKGFGSKFKAGLAGNKGALLSGLGLGVGLGAIGLATEAVSRLVNVMGDAVEAAIADEESQNRLAASLRANVPDWDGSTEAIEANIKAAQRLGFEDETLRDSLTVLVGATHDVAKAEKTMALAMDLARFKGVDLRTASEALIKVHAGQYRSLKQLGIQIDASASSAEAYAAVQAVVAGQAEAFAETNRGKLLASQIAVGEAMETLGARALPLVAAGMVELANVVVDLVEGLDALGKVLDIIGGGKMPETQEATLDLLDSLAGLVELVPGAGAVLASMARDQFGKVRTEMGTTQRYMDHRSEEIRDSLDDAGEGFGEFAEDADEAGDDVVQSFAEMVDALVGEVSRLIDEVYDPAINAAKLAEIKMEDAEQKRIISAKDSTAEQIRDAKNRRLSLSKEADQTRLKLLAAGRLSAADTDAWLGKLQRRYDKSTGAAKADIAALIARIRSLRNMTSPGLDINVRLRTQQALNQESRYRNNASGGPVFRGQPNMWQEQSHNREVFVPGVTGRVAAAREIREAVAAGPGSGGKTLDIDIHMTAAEAARDPLAVAIEMRRVVSFYDRSIE